ncbi:putative SNARE associated golgi family protein [Plasmopara halstedii]
MPQMIASYSAVYSPHMITLDDSKRNMRLLWLRFGAFVALFIRIMSYLSTLPIREYMEITSAWVRLHPVLGALCSILVFWVAVPLCLPATVFEMIAGSLFGVPLAVMIIIVGKTGGSTLAFLLGRSMGKQLIGDYLRHKFPTFRAFAEVLSSPSWKPVLLYQLSSIPNLVKIYSLAITHVSITRFAVSSAIGTTPHAILWAYIGEQATDIAAILMGEAKVTTSRMVVAATGLSLTVLAITFLVVYTKRQLEELKKRECRSSSEEGLLLSIDIDTTNSAQSTTQCVSLITPTRLLGS